MHVVYNGNPRNEKAVYVHPSAAKIHACQPDEFASNHVSSVASGSFVEANLKRSEPAASTERPTELTWIMLSRTRSRSVIGNGNVVPSNVDMKGTRGDANFDAVPLAKTVAVADVVPVSRIPDSDLRFWLVLEFSSGFTIVPSPEQPDTTNSTNMAYHARNLISAILRKVWPSDPSDRFRSRSVSARRPATSMP